MTPRHLVMLLTLAALWGASFLFIRVAVPSFGAIGLAEVRVALAGLALVAYGLLLRRMPEVRRRWRGYLVLGTINAAIPFALLSAAELEIEASLAAVLNAMTPLMGALVGALWLGNRVTGGQAIGLLLGIAGVTLVVGLAPIEVDLQVLLAVAACAGAALAYGIGANLVRERFAGEPPLALAIGQLLGASVVLLPALPLVPPRGAPDFADVACLVALALASTALAYLIYFRLIAELGATSALTVTFLVPFFGVLWGAIFLGEAIHLGTVIGGAVILVSVGLVTGAVTPAQITGRRRRAAPSRAG